MRHSNIDKYVKTNRFIFFHRRCNWLWLWLKGIGKSMIKQHRTHALFPPIMLVFNFCVFFSSNLPVPVPFIANLVFSLSLEMLSMSGAGTCSWFLRSCAHWVGRYVHIAKPWIDGHTSSKWKKNHKQTLILWAHTIYRSESCGSCSTNLFLRIELSFSILKE